MIALPIEADDAVDALRVAREELGRAVDSLNELGHRASTIAPFAEAQEAAAWAVERTAGVIALFRTAAREEDVEERRIDTEWDERD